MRKIVVAVDSFKGSLTAEQVAFSIEYGIKAIMPDCEVVKLPLSDGGEGLLDSLAKTIGGERVEVVVADPLNRAISSYYIIYNNVAVIEMALSGGLTLLADNERDPLRTTTKGMGQMIIDALDRGCDKFLIGIGGSATNDAGIGMLQELGFSFLDIAGCEVTAGGEVLERIVSIDDSGVSERVKCAKYTVACDVSNPFFGVNGAACVYAPQKGANSEVVSRLDNGLRNFASVIKCYNGIDVQEIAGSGAAGGVGGAMVALLGAELRSGIDLVLESLHFDDLIADADLVITGEGRIDKQTLQGKVPMGVLRACQRKGVRVIALAGLVSDKSMLMEHGFENVVSINPKNITMEEAMQPQTASQNLMITTISLESDIRKIEISAI